MAAAPASHDVVVQVEDHPDTRDIAILDDGVERSTPAPGDGRPARPLAVFARRDGEVVAGVHGWTWGQCCELASLWVHELLRRRGIGHTLLAAAEEEARRRGCRQVVLLTHADQAPQLYEAVGYELVGEVDDYPAGSAAYWYRKRLDRTASTPNTRRLGVVDAALRLGIAVLVVAELVAVLRTACRRAVHHATQWWTDLESTERHRARQAEIVALTGRTRRRRSGVVSKAGGPG